jgi:hypothetical protein
LKSVLLVHADHANTYGASWPSKGTVAEATGLSKQTVENYERGLVKQGKLIAVPWMLDNRTEGRKGFFLGCARRKDGTLPDALEAFCGRMEFERKNGGPCGHPLSENPSWWSGDKTPRKGHECTSCGATCHGSDQVDDTVWYPGEGTTEIPMPDWVREAVEAEVAKRTAANSTLPRGTAGGTGGRVPPVVPLNPKEEEEPSGDGSAAKPDAAGAASSVDADASTSCAADASRGARDDQTRPAKRKRRQSLGAYLKTLGDEAVNEIYWDLNATSKDAILKWAAPRAREELGIAKGTWPEGDLDHKLTLKVVEIAINTLRKHSYAEFGEVAEGYLYDFEWAPEKDTPHGTQGTADGPLRYRHSPDFLYSGTSDPDACLASIHAAIDRMSAVELAESLELFDAHRSGILADCRRVAAKTATLRADHGQDRQTLHAAAEYYRDWHRDKPQTRWPKFVVPAEMHPKQEPAAEAA